MPIITLATDIGQSDFLIPAIKGQLLTFNQAYTIVDITHQLSSNHLIQSAYLCNSTYAYFPSNTYHLVVVNLYQTNPTEYLIAKYKEGYIACPNNGILPLLLKNDLNEIIAIPVKEDKTLLGITQIVAMAFTRLYEGEALFEIGNEPNSLVKINPLPEHTHPDKLEAHIIFIDKYENVVVNLTQKEFETKRRGRKFQIVIKRNDTIETISQSYADVPEGEKMAWFNSAGYLELGMNKGNMAGLFGLKSFSEKDNSKAISQADKSYYHTIRINFLE